MSFQKFQNYGVPFLLILGMCLNGVQSSRLGEILGKTIQNEASASSGRIFNGVEAKPHEFPHFVGVMVQRPGELPNLECGGSLIAPDWVVTAAHCHVVEDADYLPLYRIGAGMHNWTDETEPGRQIRNITAFILHEGYSIETLFDDIALVKVDPPFELTDTVQLVNLPQANYRIPVGTKTIAAGWGIRQLGQPKYEEVLRKTNLTTIDDQLCNEANKDNQWGLVVVESMVCTNMAINGGTGVCRGDSGSPLVTVDNGVFTQVGIPSWTLNCEKYPPVFTEVAYHVPWIENKTGGAVKA